LVRVRDDRQAKPSGLPLVSKVSILAARSQRLG
jgi:hypothetical protein